MVLAYLLHLKTSLDSFVTEDGDKLVTTVLAAIPNSVYTKGVVPESVVKARYYMVSLLSIQGAKISSFEILCSSFITYNFM